MGHRRAVVSAVLIGGLCVLVGCNAVPGFGNAAAPPDGFLSQKVATPGDSGKFSVEADLPLVQTETVHLADDLTVSASDDVSLVLRPADINIFLNGQPASLSLKKNEGDGLRRASITFFFASEGGDACASDDAVGPFELTYDDGILTLEETGLPVEGGALALIKSGRFEMCTEVQANFDGTIVVDAVSFEFGSKEHGQEGEKICHPSRDDDNERHTITVAEEALQAHLDHGDSIGPCEEEGHGDDDKKGDKDGGEDDHEGDDGEDSDDSGEDSDDSDVAVIDCSQLDDDADGVNNCDDLCPGSAPGATVGADGCEVMGTKLAADAGPDVTVLSGEAVSRTGNATVLTGNHDPATLRFVWEQVAGPPVTFQSNSPPIFVDTTGAVGDVVFRLTVTTPDGIFSAVDEFTITVMPIEITDLTVGRWHNALLHNNQTATLWGWNRYGQLGDGSQESDVVSIDAGPKHTLLAKADGTVWTFGQNVLSNSATPVQVDGVTNVVQVGALAVGGILLRGDGSVWGFTDDRNASCELANAPTAGAVGVLGPMPIPDLPPNITAISTGAVHALALDADGNAWVWGSRFGCTPHIVLDNVVSVSAGGTNLCLFVRGDGTAWGMGFNLHGQLGNGTTVSDFTTPTQVVGLSDVVTVAAGDRHSLFLLGDGTLWATGWNHDCQLGLELEINPVSRLFSDAVLTPMQVMLSDVVAIAGGNTHTVAVTADQTVWVWGLNNVKQLTQGTLTTLPFTVCMPTSIEWPVP